MRNVQKLAVLGVILAASQAAMCSSDNTAKAPAPKQALAAGGPGKLTLRIAFDGGYFYDFSQPDEIDVHTLQSAHYKMTARVVTDNNQEISLDGFTVTFRPDGVPAPAQKPGLPPLDASATDCKDADKTKPNNRFFIPDLKQVASAMGTEIRTDAPKSATMRLAGGGALSVHQVGGCVEFRQNGSAMGSPRSIASGHQGIWYEWPDIQATSVTLVRTNAAHVEQATTLKPNASGLITLWISDAFDNSTGGGATGHDVGHFKDHFDGVFKHVDESKRVTLYWRNPYLVSPGIDCPPGSAGP